MKDWKQVPIPQLMLDNCEIDSRGMPVPFVVLKDKEGKHHFKINDTEKTLKCLFSGLCTICGTQISLRSNRWLVGGIASAFDKAGYYIDHPVHKECGHYALQVCPYLAIRNYNGKVDMVKLQEKFQGQATLNNPTVDQDRLPLFVFLRPLQIAYFSKIDNTDIRIKALGPYHEVEYWDEGEQITDIHVVELKLKGTKWEKYLINIQEHEQNISKNKV